MSGTPRILVTGASGFIGSRALAPLRKLGFEVHAAARDPARIPDVPEVRRHAVDLLAPKTAGKLLDSVRPTHLLHLAWYAEHGKFWNSPLNLDWLPATLALLRAFAESGGRRFVGAGSCAEYDWDVSPSDEDQTPLRPANLYGAAKASAFLTGSAFAQNTGVSFAWGRIFHLFGAGEHPDRIVPALIRAHLRGGRLDCGPEAQWRDFLPVTSVAEAFAHLCASEARGAVNVGSGRGETLGGLSAAIAGLTGTQGDVRFGARRDSGPERLVPVVRRLTSETGWKPPESLEAGLRETLDWWKTRS